jgi:nitroreductase
MQKLATTEVPLHPLLAGRWSPRGFDRAHAIEPQQLTALLEAARWAPSANNSQPWRFIVAQRGEPAFETLFDLLMRGNQLWAGAASALILVVADTTSPSGDANPYALYDTGQAVASLSAQAGHEGLSVHQMGGFDRAAAAQAFGLRDGLEPVVVVAIGRHDAQAQLTEALAERERAPRVRRPIDEMVLRPATRANA